MVSAHAIAIAAPPAHVWASLLEVDFAASPLVRVLFRLRGLPGGRFRLTDFERIRFIPLETEPPWHLTWGIIGRFWTFSGDLVRFEPAEFAGFDAPGYARAVWSFSIRPDDDGAGSVLTTATRVRCTDATSRRRFLRYWRLVGPFSGLVRREALRLAKRAAERP